MKKEIKLGNITDEKYFEPQHEVLKGLRLWHIISALKEGNKYIKKEEENYTLEEVWDELEQMSKEMRNIERV